MTNKYNIVFATSNKNKIIELNKLLPKYSNIIIKNLKDVNIIEDIPETSNTIEGNAIQKAKYVFEKYGYNCFSEDTGLIIDSLNGEPGIYSARYAGKNRNSNDNMDKVLLNLKNKKSRNAHFKTVIALNISGQIFTFEGKVEGQITMSKIGISGFGYDPIFQPIGYSETFAELDIEGKNKISHRGKAVKKLIAFFKSKEFNTLIKK